MLACFSLSMSTYVCCAGLCLNLNYAQPHKLILSADCIYQCVCLALGTDSAVAIRAVAVSPSSDPLPFKLLDPAVLEGHLNFDMCRRQLQTA